MKDRKVECLSCFGEGAKCYGALWFERLLFRFKCETCNGHRQLIEKRRWSLVKRSWVSEYWRIEDE